MPKRAIGLPDPAEYGSIHKLPTGKLIPWIIQEHKARRAGRHYDIRFGPGSLHSFATRKEMPKPGGKIMVYQQPLHSGDYASFEGEIPKGYGQGTVKARDKGFIYVVKAEPNKVVFVIAHKKGSEHFAMIRKQDKSWLLVNTTPTKPIEHKKVQYKSVPSEDVQKLFDPKYLHQAKIDGAAALYQLFRDHIQAVSYRPTSQGYPIVHSYRIGGLNDVTIPPHLVGTILRGEIWGEQKGKAIPPQELGGILNSVIAKSLQTQKEKGVKLRNAIFNILQYGKKPVSMDAPYAEREEMIREVLGHLPPRKFHVPRTARTPSAQKKMWKDIKRGLIPETTEGIVAWPVAGGKPLKSKFVKERDVWIKGVFPTSTGPMAGQAAGGFTYSLSPDGPVVGKVGTGFTNETKQDMWKNQADWVGRMAKIRSQGQFESGAYRAPGFIARHEDYPAVKVGSRTLEVEVADTFPKQAEGLSGRLLIPPDKGMLFVYPQEQKLAFWMKDTHVPLSIAFIKEGKIAQIEDLEPHCLIECVSDDYVKYALEVPRGWFEQNGIGVGASVDIGVRTVYDSPAYIIGTKTAAKAESNTRHRLVKAKDTAKAHKEVFDLKEKKTKNKAKTRSWVMPHSGPGTKVKKLAAAVKAFLE